MLMKGEKKNDVKIKEKGKKKGGMRGNRKKIEGKPIFDVDENKKKEKKEKKGIEPRGNIKINTTDNDNVISIHASNTTPW